MIKFKEQRKRYTSHLTLSNGEYLPVILDTGAMVSTLSFSSLIKLLRCDEELLSKFICDHRCITIHGVDEIRHDAAPCYLRDVTFGDLHLDRFYFLLSKGVAISSIGYDFVKACSMEKALSNNFVVTDFDAAVYKQVFIESSLSVEPKELLAVQTKFDPVVWYRQLPAEYKDKLHQWSTPLYTILNVGQYLDEFDGVLAGFREQYGV